MMINVNMISKKIDPDSLPDDWPLTIFHGELRAAHVNSFEPDEVPLLEITFKVDDRVFAINGTAKRQPQFSDIAEIWADNPGIPGTKLDISSLIRAGEALMIKAWMEQATASVPHAIRSMATTDPRICLPRLYSEENKFEANCEADSQPSGLFLLKPRGTSPARLTWAIHDPQKSSIHAVAEISMPTELEWVNTLLTLVRRLREFRGDLQTPRHVLPLVAVDGWSLVL